MSKHRSEAYKARRREWERKAAINTVRWYKMSEEGVSADHCWFHRRNCGQKMELYCGEEAKWIMESADRRWVLCQKHAAYLHNRPKEVRSFVGKNKYNNGL
jgi:hypothetical protein